MAIQPSITNSAVLAAQQTVAASTTLVTMTGFSLALAVGQKVHWRWFVAFTLGVTGGYKFQIVTPSTGGSTVFTNCFTVTDTVTPATIVGTQLTTGAFANALAVAGNHFMNCEGSFLANATAGNLLFQFACNSAANSIVAQPGSFVQCWFN